MLEFSKFVTFRDTGLILPIPAGQPHAGDKRDCINTIPALDDLDTEHDAVLEFNLVATGPVALRMAIKDHDHHSAGDVITEHDFVFFDEFFNPPDSTHPQVWREVMHGSRLRRGDNKIAAVIDGTGTVHVSDFTLTYHAKT
jgi:hypothetical protein